MKVNIKNLSVNQADSFLIMLEHKERKINILLDGNRESIANAKVIFDEISKLDQLDYIIVTHIDNDHLGGIVKILEADDAQKKLIDTKIIYNFVTEKNISFNQAKRFEKIIKSRKIIKSYTDCYEADDFLFFLSIEARKICNDIGSKNKIFITFLGPTKENANKVWENFDNGQEEKAELINENSIVFMLEAEDKRAIFTGDSNWCQVERQIEKIFDGEDYTVDLIKVPHHGADHNNIGLEDFVKRHKCNKLLVTGKEIWDHEHPHERIIENLQKNNTSGQLEIYSKVDLASYFKTKKETIEL